MKLRVFFLFLSCTLALASFSQPLKRVRPEKVGLDSRQLRYADEAIENHIRQGEIPGAVLAVVRHGKMAYLKAYGNRQVYPDTLPMTTDVIFDMASCSKSMSTAVSAMILLERGKVRLYDPVSRFIPGFEGWKSEDGKESRDINVMHLLTHSSGLRPYLGVAAVAKEYGSPCPSGVMDYISHMRRDFKPGTDFQYSCLNFVTLQNIIQKVSGQSLRDFAQENIFRPLGMRHTDYLPCAPDADGKWQNTSLPVWAEEGKDWKELVAPETVIGPESVDKGMVHDPLARLLNGGISGNAGIFTTADDVAILCAALQNGGEWNGHRILHPQTVKKMRTVPEEVSSLGRALGWDSYSDYSGNKGDLFSPDVICHTGFTGTSIVIDFGTDTSVILLINAVHPDEGHSVGRMRAAVSSIVAASIIE